LRGGDRHNAVGGARPQKATSLETLRKQTCALTIVPDNLQQVAATPTKAKQMAAERIAMKDFLNLQRQACKTLPHVGMAGRQPDSNAARKSNHRRRSCPASASITQDSVASSGAPSIVRLNFAPNAIVIVPRLGSEHGRAAAAALTAIGTNAGPSPAAANCCCRHRYNRRALTPARRHIRRVRPRLVQRQDPAQLLRSRPIPTLFLGRDDFDSCHDTGSMPTYRPSVSDEMRSR
jgi:hypothetical protein